MLLTQQQRNAWASAFWRAAPDLRNMTREDFDLANRLRDLGHTAEYAAARVRRLHTQRHTQEPTVDQMLRDLWAAGWTTCDPRTVGPNSAPWSEEQLRRQWKAMKRNREGATL